MPNYQYTCFECDFTWERKKTLAEFEEKKTDPCPKCGDECKQSYSAVGIKFGPGFFRDGYASAKTVTRSEE